MMKPDVRDLVPHWIIDELPPDASLVEQASVAADCFALIALGVGQVSPSSGLRDSVLAGAQRPMAVFTQRVARLIDVSLERADELLARLSDPRTWELSPLPGIGFHDLPAGPSLAGAVVGFVKVAAGQTFPTHTHLGDEIVLVLQGALRINDALDYEVGDYIRSPAGSTHIVAALPGEDLLWISVSDVGIDFAPIGGPILTPSGFLPN